MDIGTQIRVWAQAALARFGYQLKQIPRGDNPVLQPWHEDEEFVKLLWQVQGRTLVDEVRCFMLYQFARLAAHIPGDVAEVGVYKGGTARLLCKTLGPAGKTLHLFDTFSGMPPTDRARDLHGEGDFSDTSLESVRKYLGDCGDVRLYEGIFPATAKPVEDTAFSLVHVDVDVYKSAMDCCEFFYPRVQRGGFMVFDDYGFRSCPGLKTAVDEFFAGKPEEPLFLPSGQCLIIRS
ncbi:MAG: TylF/MycF/NovP-related O-methyltransferase [Thermodesulfovibrionales bacterium]